MDDKITIGLHEYMDRLLSNLRTEFELKLSALREEYKKSELLIAEAKAAVDKHFDESNNYRVQLDKQATSFMTSRDVDERVKLAVANLNGSICNQGTQIKVMWGIMVALILLLISVLAKEFIGR